MWFDPQAKLLIQRRKDIIKDNYGLPNALYMNPIESNKTKRSKLQKNAIVALETNLDEVFKTIGITPTKK
jgi:uncharacterized protein YqcC (DUF446 family)